MKLGDAYVDLHVDTTELKEAEAYFYHDWVDVATLLGVAFIVGWLLAALVF